MLAPPGTIYQVRPALENRGLAHQFHQPGPHALMALQETALHFEDSKTADSRCPHLQMKNTSPGDLTLLVVMGCAPGHIDVYDIFSPEARPHRIFPMPWDEDCPPEVPAGFRDLSHENDSISQHFRLLPEG